MSAGAAAVGLRLRQERLKRGWSQEGLCRGICAASYLSKIEQGRVQAAPELLALLMKRLDLPWYGENLPELEGLVERRYAQLLDGEQEAFQDSRAAFSQALETILSSPLAADGLVLDAVDRQDPSDIPAALEPYLDRRQLALLRIVQDREPEAVRLLPEAYCFLMAGIAGYEQGGDYTGGHGLSAAGLRPGGPGRPGAADAGMPADYGRRMLQPAGPGRYGGALSGGGAHGPGPGTAGGPAGHGL